MVDVKFLRTERRSDTFDSLTTKKVTKSTINLTAMISASSTSLVYLFDPPLDLLR